MAIKNLFSEKRKVMSQKSIADMTGSGTPVESSEYIDNYLEKKSRYLPPINFATASNFAKFGSAKQYSEDAVKRIYNTYPYDGSLSEKISWLNSSNFYDLYVFEERYPRTCGYAVFSPQGWGARDGGLVYDFGKSDAVEYIQLKGGPHADPNSGSLKLSRQFPLPYDGRANIYDAATGINRDSNLALDLDNGATVEFWFKGAGSPAEATEVFSQTTTQAAFDLWNGYTGTSEGNSYGRLLLTMTSAEIKAHFGSGSQEHTHTVNDSIFTSLSDGGWHHIAVTAKQVQDGSDFKIEWNDFLDGQWLSRELSPALTARLGAVTGSLIANIGAARIPSRTQSESANASVTTLVNAGTNEGYGKVSGSIDEFRYWKKARTPKEIKRFWNTQIAGGSNTDNMKFSGSAQPVDLGVYYKFNEGNVGNANTDSTVLDYSGRITNGTWVGYIAGASRIAGETASAMIQSSASVSEFKDPIIYSTHPDVSSVYTELVESGEEWDLQNNMALYHTMPEWITSEDQDEGGEQLKKLTQIIASYLDIMYLQISAIPNLADKKYPFEQIISYDPDEQYGEKQQTFDYKNAPSRMARHALEDSGMMSEEIFSLANELAYLANRDEQGEFEQKLYDIKNTIYQNIYNNITYIYKSKGTEKAFRNLIRCYGVDDELIKINLYIDNATYSFEDANYRSTAVKDKYIDFNDADRVQSTIYQSASYSTANSISYIPGLNPENAPTAGATGSAMTFEADALFPLKFSRTHTSGLWYSYPYVTSSVFGCHESAVYQDVKATLSLKGISGLLNQNSTTLTLTQTDGTDVVFTTDNTKTKAASTNLIIGTQGIASDADATESLWNALNATITLGNLDMTLSPSVYGGETEVTLTQDIGGYAGNTLVVNPFGIYAQDSVSSATPRFTGGVGVAAGDFSSQFTGLHASIIVEGKASLNAQNGTTLTLINADGTSVNFVTDSSQVYSLSQTNNLGAPDINTATITTDYHATVALHDSFKRAIQQGTLKMSIVPETLGTGTSFQLIQNLPGSDGNTSVTVPTGIDINSAGDGVNTTFTGGESDVASFEVYAIRDVIESNDVKFMLTSSTGAIPTLTSSLFQDVYDNERWLFAVKLYPNSDLEGSHVSGSGGSGASVSGSWTLQFQGYNTLLDQVQNSFSSSDTVSSKYGTYFTNANKRIYAGARRENFSGSLTTPIDFKIGAVRVWDDYLSDSEILAHAKDPTNYGRDRAYKNSYLFNMSTTPDSDTTFIPQFETLLLNWTFEDVTGSTSGAYLQDHYGGSAWNGSFEVLDYSSGSDEKWDVDARYKYHYTGRGDWFLPSSEDSTSLVDLNYLSAVKTNLPEVSSGEDMVSILSTDDDFFTRDSKPINHYFSIEKNMYQNISEEMLRMFATVVEFNNIVGEPVNRYRQEYKTLGKLREAFFRKVSNIPDFNKFVKFYQWIDISLSDMISQLIPMSANVSDGIKTIVESHILERNKYWNKFPTLEIKAEPIVGRLKGISELTYDWEHGHAPLNPTPYENEDTNCLWWQQRSEASASFTAGNQVDTDRNTLRRILTSDITTNKILATGEYTDPTDYPNSGFPNAAEINLAQSGAFGSRTQYKGSTYALRRFSKPYKLELDESSQLHGGINYHPNKRRELTKSWTVVASPMSAYLTLAPGYTYDLKDCNDVIDPSEKQFYSYAIDPGGGFGSGPAPEKGAHFGPFNFVSSSVTANSSLAEDGIDIVNLHDDSYGDSNERPLQGPFTERFVGGMAHRHQDISDTSHTNFNRTENFRITNLVKNVGFNVVSGDQSSAGTRDSDLPFDRFYRDGVAKRPVNIRNILTTTDTAMSQSALGNYDNPLQILNTHNEGEMFLAKLHAATGSDGFYTLNSPTASLVIADTAETPKLLAVGQTLLDSTTPLASPFTSDQFNPYLSNNKITERFSAPGDPSTAGDAFGGFGIDKEKNKYSVYNALPWRNRQVRIPMNALLTAHCDAYGAFSGSVLSADEAATATTASFHKTHRNTDYFFKHTGALTAFRSNSVFFGAVDDPRFFKNNVTSVDNLTKMSISVWFKLVSVSGTQTLISLNDNVLLWAVNDDITFAVYGDAGFIYFDVLDCLKADTWHHVVLAFDQGDTQEWRTSTLDYATMDSTNKFYPKIWLDGTPQTVTTSGATAWTGTSQVLDDINVGTRGDTNSAWDNDGYIQDISLWNTVLSNDQVSEIYRLPGYDSFGPGDLTRLDYVTTDADSNQLHAWWLFNDASTVSDMAPIGNALDLAAKGGTTPAVNTDHFLPANYYDTECAPRYDNYYVQHPIPANDFGYAWITASADHSVGCEFLTTASFITSSVWGSITWNDVRFFGIYETADESSPYDLGSYVPVDFAGLNFNIYEPASSSANTLGYPNHNIVNRNSAYTYVDNNYVNEAWGDATYSEDSYHLRGTVYSTPDNFFPGADATLNAIILHRQGPYGYPSWKQTRGGQHPIVREHKKHNVVSLNTVLEKQLQGDKRRRELGFVNVRQTPVSLDFPMVHNLVVSESGQINSVSLKHSYANNLVTFSKSEIIKTLGKDLSEKPRQMYDDIKDTYLAVLPAFNGKPLVDSFRSMIYKQSIFPKAENTYLSGTRGRLLYAETAEYISQSKNGEYRTFWRDSLADRRRDDGALNSMGYPIHSDFNSANGAGVEHVSKLVIGEGNLSIWPLDVGVGNNDHYESVSDNVKFLKGLYTMGGAPATTPSADEYGGTWGELHRDPVGTLFGSLTTDQLSTLNSLDTRHDAPDYKHFMSDHHFITAPTASQCFNHYQLAGASRPESGYDLNAMYPIVGPVVDSTTGAGLRGPTPSNWKTHVWSGRSPWYDSYEDYSEDVRVLGQEYSILPEFKISEHMDYYIEQGTFFEDNYKFLSIPGGSVSSSAETEKANYQEQFWKEYSHSDFIEQFQMVLEDHKKIAPMTAIELRCSAVKKLLPYDGFYPVQRSLQLGALLSSSYAPYLTGSSEATYGPTSDTDSEFKYRAERLQSFLQPFYAPGIMYNSIKSGIAVDYPIHTSQAAVNFVYTDGAGASASGSYAFGHVNSASGSSHVVTDEPDFRMPFEALINPDAFLGSGYDDITLENKRLYLTAPYYGSSSFYAQWEGTSKPHYKLAVNNFAAEVPNFFLKNKTLTTFRSKRQTEFATFASGTTYYMDVVLQKSPDLIMNQHSLTYFGLGSFSGPEMTCSGWGYGPSYWVTGSVQFDGSIAVPGTPVAKKVSNTGDPTYAVHAPPYFYGKAVARLAFTPHDITEMAPGESARFDIDTIIDSVLNDTTTVLAEDTSKTTYFKEIGIGQSKPLTEVLQWLKINSDENVSLRYQYPAKQQQMQISSSVNLFGTTFLPDVDFDPDTQLPRGVTLLKDVKNKAWVIHSKWETPVLNFADGTGGGLGPGETNEDMTSDVTGSWWKSPEIPLAHQRPLGMWNGFGSRTSGETGITLSLKESYPELISARGSTTGSLIQACGFQAESQKIGDLATSKIISEAVVAIPFVDTEGERKFFALGDTHVESRNIFLSALDDAVLNLREDPAGRSIRQMAQRMPKYVFPPHMDFLNNPAIEPFAMYIFEFSHTLSQLDLSRIWQNVLPDIGVTAEKSTSVLKHATGKNEFFRGNPIPPNTRWMVFKVKQRSATNYFEMTEDSKDDHQFKFNFAGGGTAEEYNYNWPYDFFSLVELAKVNTRMGIGDNAIPIKPKPQPTFGDTIAADTGLEQSDVTIQSPATFQQLTGIELGNLTDTLVNEDEALKKTINKAKSMAKQQLNKSGDNTMLKMMKQLSGGSASKGNLPSNDPNF